MRAYQKNKTPELLFYRNKIRNLTNRIVKIEQAETVRRHIDFNWQKQHIWKNIHKIQNSQAKKCRAFKTNRALNKHRISQNHWTVVANSLSFGAERSGN